MTWRYVQSMASKCLILGRMPEEMRQLFDYRPIIEIDLAHACEQLEEILGNFHKYDELIERNYVYVKEHHQWPNRITQIAAYLKDFGETVAAAT